MKNPKEKSPFLRMHYKMLALKLKNVKNLKKLNLNYMKKLRNID